MSYAKEKWGNLRRILNKGPGSIRERLEKALYEVGPPVERDGYPSPALFQAFSRLYEEVVSLGTGPHSRIREGLGKMSDDALADLKRRMIALADQIGAS